MNSSPPTLMSARRLDNLSASPSPGLLMAKLSSLVSPITNSAFGPSPHEKFLMYSRVEGLRYMFSSCCTRNITKKIAKNVISCFARKMLHTFLGSVIKVAI